MSRPGPQVLTWIQCKLGKQYLVKKCTVYTKRPSLNSLITLFKRVSFYDAQSGREWLTNDYKHEICEVIYINSFCFWIHSQFIQCILYQFLWIVLIHKPLKRRATWNAFWNSMFALWVVIFLPCQWCHDCWLFPLQVHACRVAKANWKWPMRSILP